MSRHPLLPLLVLLVAAALTWWWLRPRDPGGAGAPATRAAPPATRTAPREEAGRAPVLRQVSRSRYKLSYAQEVQIGDGQKAHETGGATVAGVLTTTERSDGRTEAQLTASKIELRGAEAPSPDDVALPVQLVTEGGVLRAIAFPPEMPRPARAVLTGLLATFQHTDQPGSAWSVAEEDLLGRYLAEYRREAEGVVARSRPRYTALRGPRGLVTESGGALKPDERSEFSFDRRGLVSAAVRIDCLSAPGDGVPPVKIHLEARLEREAEESLSLMEAEALPAQPISDHLDHAGLARGRDVALVAGASSADLLAEALRVARLDRKQPDVEKLRAVSLRRLSAQARLDPRAAEALSEAIRKDARSPETIGLLAGALGSAGVPAATNALVGLLGDPLPEAARSTVLSHLALTQAPTRESVAALSSISDRQFGQQAMLALGAEARTLGEHPDGATAVDLLLDRYAHATDHAERRLYLQALANSGSPRALPVMKAALGGDNLELARLATYGLRFIPGDEVDALLLQLIRGATPVILDAIRATAYRPAAFWRPQLEAAREQYAGHKHVTDAIQAVLGRLR